MVTINRCGEQKQLKIPDLSLAVSRMDKFSIHHFTASHSEKLRFSQTCHVLSIAFTPLKQKHETLTQCCGSRMFIPNPGSGIFQLGSRVQMISYPGSGSKSKNVSIFYHRIPDPQPGLTAAWLFCRVSDPH